MSNPTSPEEIAMAQIESFRTELAIEILKHIIANILSGRATEEELEWADYVAEREKDNPSVSHLLVQLEAVRSQ